MFSIVIMIGQDRKDEKVKSAGSEGKGKRVFNNVGKLIRGDGEMRVVEKTVGIEIRVPKLHKTCWL